MRGESENSVNLFAGDAEFLHKLVNAHVFDIFKDGGNRCPGTFEYPCAAALAGNAFNVGTLGPVERCHVRYPSFIVVNRNRPTHQTAFAARFCRGRADGLS